MSETEAPQPEQRSSVKLSRNAKGDCQIELKVYDGFDVDELLRVRNAAVEHYRELEREFYGPPLGSAEAAA